MLREYAFIRQNKEKWLKIEQELEAFDQYSASVWAAHYAKLVNDLAFARTQYPNAQTTQYLNGLVSAVHLKLHRVKPEAPHRLLRLFADEVPQLLWIYRRYLAYALALFVASALLAVFSMMQNPSFAQVVLGEEYVHQTLESIDQGKPLAVYGSSSQWGSFIGITINNIWVGLRLYAAGVLAGLGSALMLFQNSFMVGTFQYFFIQKRLFWDSARGIWLHGTFEISALIVEGACGLILGASWLFPGTYSRSEAFQRGMRDSLKIYVSTLPFTLVAGLVEGYLTRYAPSMPGWLCALMIGMFATVVVFYYILYPYLYHLKGKSYDPLSTV